MLAALRMDIQRQVRIGMLGALLASAWPASAAVQTNGPATSYAVTTNAAGNRSVVIQLSPTGTVEVTPFAADVVRVRFHFAGLYEREEVAISKPFSNWPAFDLTLTDDGGTNLLVETGQLQVQLVLSNKFQVHFKDPSGRDLLRDFHIEYDLDYHPIADTSAYAQVAWPNSVTSVSNLPTGFKLKAIKVMPTNEAYFGLGDFGGPMNRRGQVLQFWSQDTYAFGESHNPKYTSLPFWYGVQGPTTARAAFAYGVFFHNPARPVVELTSGFGDTYAFHAGDDQLDYFFFGGGTNHTMAAVLDRFSELTGRPAYLPKWAYGYHQSRHSYFTQQSVMDLIDSFRASNVPCDAVYLDIGTQEWTNDQPMQLTFDGGNFTNVAALVSYATNAGVQLVPLVEPCLATNDPLYAEPLANLHFLKNNDFSTHVGTNFLQAISWLDFSSGPARGFWKRELTNYLAAFGFQALWNDLNEPNENDMPLNVLYFLDGRYGTNTAGDTRRWHSNNKNTYNVLQARVSHEALRAQYPARRPFVLSRSAWPGIQAYAAGWSGDNVSSYEHLRFNTRLASSVMISGQAHFGNDVGGFVEDTQPELLSRWIQAGALSPLFRNHTTINTANQEPWAFGEPYLLWNRRWINFRYELMPYLYTLAWQASTNGMPMNVPAVFGFPDDTNTWAANEYDFLVGSHLLAAPVLASGAVTRAVYLPAGTRWYHWADDAAYEGGQTLEVRASMGALPLFARAGAIVPMGPVLPYANAFAPDYLDLHVWPGASNRFTLHEDDGWSTNHAAGQWARTPISVGGSATSLTVTIEARAGPYDPGARDFYVVVHAFSNATSVTADGAPLERLGNRAELEAASGEGWAYDTVTRRAVVRVADTGAGRTLALAADTQSPPATPFPAAYSNVAVAGTFNYWNEADRNLRLVGTNLWAGVVDLTGLTNLEFKFVANDAWSVTNWGDTNATSQAVPLSGVADGLGGNISVTGLADGVYTFTFRSDTLAYSLGPASATDSDGDGADDAWEHRYGLHPALASDGAFDLDGDGLANADEYAAGGNPVRADTDGDGFGDASEFLAGTSLTNAASYLRVADHAPGATNAGVTVTWEAVTGRSYDVFFATNLLEASWSALLPYTGVLGSGSVTVPDTNAAESRHYRIGVRLAP